MDCEQILVVIPARGGSKGIPGKNIFPLAGEPLIVHSIRHALTSKLASRVIVSTDSENIAAVARENGAEVIERPAEISDDLASSEAALLHVLDQLREQENYTPDLVVFLQYTSPLRRNDDIDRAIETLKRQQADSLLSVSPSHRFLWTEQNGEAKAINYGPAPAAPGYDAAICRKRLPLCFQKFHSAPHEQSPRRQNRPI